MSDSPMLVQLTAAQLRELIAECVADVLAEHEPPEPSGLVDQTALARRLGISRSSLYVLRDQGLPVIWVLDSPRFDFDEVLAWLRARSTGARQLNEPSATGRDPHEGSRIVPDDADFQHESSCTVNRIPKISRDSSNRQRNR